MKKKVSLKMINNVLGIVLLFFGVFDTTRNYTLLPVSFGYLKDIAIYLLFFINIFSIRFKSVWVGVVFLAIFIVSPLGLHYSGLEFQKFIIYYIKYLEVPLLLIIFMNFKIIFSYSINNYFKIYIAMALILAFINVFGYYVENPIVGVHLANENMNPDLYKGRITVGQPPLAIFPVLFAFCYFLINCHKIRNIFIAGVLLILIFLSTSNTGLIAVVLCSILIFFLSRGKGKINIITCASIFIFCFILVSPYLLSIIDISMYTNKIISVLNGGSDVSLNVRRVHWKQALDNIAGFFNVIFGSGIFGYIRDGIIFDIENTYVLVFMCYGVLGVIILLFGVIKVFIIIKNIIDNRKKTLLFCALIIFILHFLTLDIFFCYMLYFSLGMFIQLAKDAKSKVREVKNGEVINYCNSNI